MSTNQKILESYSISTAPKEILDIILKCGADQESFMWQTFNDRRVIFKVRTLRLDLSAHLIHLAYDSSHDQVDPKTPLYVKVSFREMIFKASVKQMGRQELVLEIPKEVRVRELRNATRLSFAPGKHFITMRPYIAHMRPDQVTSMKLNLKDISKVGLGVLVSDSNISFFKKGKLLELVALDSMELPKSHLAQVVYIARQRGGKIDQYKGVENRVGLRMLDLIPTTYIEVWQTL